MSPRAPSPRVRSPRLRSPRVRSPRVRRAALACLTASALATIGAAAVPGSPAAAQSQTVTDVAYAPADPPGSAGHLLDLYLPGGDDRPLVIWSSGSAWMSDDGKSGADAIADALNPHGYAVAGVSVRSSSQAQFPGQVHDVKAAVRYLRANADQYGLDPDRFAIMGGSSGGWVASMAAVTGGVADLEGNLGTTGVSSRVQAAVPFYGPSDFLQMDEQALPGSIIDHGAPDSPESQLMGCPVESCPELTAQANPITYVDADDPPMMLLHGQDDVVVPPGQSEILYEAVRDQCGQAQYFSVPGAGHNRGEVMGASGAHTVHTAEGCQETVTTGTPDPTWDTIEAFLADALAVGGTPSPTATTDPPTTDPPTTDPPPSSPPSSPPAGDAACEVTYAANAWNNGFVADVTIANTGESTIDGWSLSWSWPDGQQVTNAWNATVSESGGTVTATNVDYNATIAPGADTTFGFQGTHDGTHTAPTEFTLDGSACTVG